MLVSQSLLFAGMLLASPGGSGTALPPEISSAFRESFERAESAANAGEHQKALAFYKGLVYDDGVTVAIDSDTTGHERARAITAVNEAARVWHDQLRGDTPIRLVNSPNDADVTIRFVDSLNRVGSHTLGHISLKKQFRWSQSTGVATVQGSIEVVRSHSGSQLSTEETSAVLMHELGHLLGLDDAKSTGRLMGPLMRGAPLAAPIASESSAVRQARSIVRQRIDSVQNLMARNALVLIPTGAHTVERAACTCGHD